MKVQKGGTDMWCPECKEIRTCKSIPGAQVTYDSADYSQRQHFIKHDDVNWFQRGRRCLKCDHEFLTGEADMQFLEELVELRDALADLKKHAERYTSESKKASKSLERLTNSLGVLRALRLYKEA